MRFPENYFEDEVRDGFYVPSMMKRYWAAEMEVLSDIAELCKKHDIKWFVDYGTLLGAIRNKGFIPWDDDVDISMLRPDYERFMAIAPQELPSYYTVSNVQLCDDYDDLLSNVSIVNAVPLPPDLLEKFHGCPFIASVDIFPLDGVDDDPKREDQRKNYARMLASLANRIRERGQFETSTQQIIKKYEEVYGIKFNFQEPIRHQILQYMDEAAARYKNTPTRRICKSYHWLYNDTHVYPSKLFNELTELDFECMKVPALKDYGTYISVHYGEDYMTPMRSPASHNYPSYRPEEDQMEAEGRPLPNKYVFRTSDLEHNKPTRKSIQTQIAEFDALLIKINTLTRSTIENQQYDNTLQILSKAQSIAVQYGTYLESHIVSPEGMVKKLEAYCESVYALYTAISSNNISEQFSAQLYELDTLQNDISEEGRHAIEIKEVVFFPFKASSWPLMKPLWEQYHNDPQYRVHVVPIPYYHRDALGQIHDPIYEADQFPDEVHAESYENFPVDTILPSIIVTQNTYDKYNVGLSTTAYYYADHLKSCCDELIYLPWLQTEDVDFNDPVYGTAVINLRNFVCMPGVTNADIVFVSSDILRSTYIELLTEFAGEDTRQHWEKVVQTLTYSN